MEGIKNIIFDLGGVLWNIDYHKAINEFEKLGIPAFDKNYFSKAAQHNLFDDLDTGRISSRGFITHVKSIIGSNTSDEAILSAWNSMLLDFPHERIELLEGLSKKFDLYLLSNTNEIHIEELKKMQQQDKELDKLNRLFNKMYLSFQIGMRKPDKEVFEFVLNDGKLDPCETFFIDDSHQHIVGANALGIQTKWLDLDVGETTEKYFQDWL